MNIDQVNNDDCCGCRACEKICPKNAITMVYNNEGFLVPIIDKNLCVNCGLCLKSCPQFNTFKEKKDNSIEAFAARAKKTKDLLNGSSGGIFSTIAKFIIENKGFVYGCCFDENMNPIHLCVNKIEDIAKLCGSKYVQSDTNNTYENVKEQLEDNNTVLYIGTPCQIAGLKSFLKNDFKNLYTIDLVCHGVPSPKLFKKYIEWLEKKYKDKVEMYYFRNKIKSGWGLTSRIKFKSGKEKIIDFRLDPYYKTFIDAKNYRECCYRCKYSNLTRIGDITLADFWGIEKEHPDFYSPYGNSAIIINNKKGKFLFDSIKNQIDYISTDINKILRYNKNLQQPSKRYYERSNIYLNLEKKGFDRYIKEDLKFRKNFKVLLKNLLPYKFKFLIKNIFLKRKKKL